MECCKWCPVRRECLEDSLEPTWTVTGIRGGTTKTERTAMRMAVVKDLSTATPFEWTFTQSLSRTYTVSSDIGHPDRTYQDHDAIVKETARRLDETFDERYPDVNRQSRGTATRTGRPVPQDTTQAVKTA